jgi:hypothetical protein
MKRPIRDAAIFAVPVCSSPAIDVASLDDVPSTEYVQLAEQALFIALLSGVTIMACSFAVQLLSG